MLSSLHSLASVALPALTHDFPTQTYSFVDHCRALIPGGLVPNTSTETNTNTSTSWAMNKFTHRSYDITYDAGLVGISSVTV